MFKFCNSAKPYCAEYWNFSFSFTFPDFVLIIITPFAPLLPYTEVAEASFKTDTLAMSLGLILLKLSSSTGTPSRINKGSMLPLIDPTPLKITVLFAPGCPLLVEMFKPGT